MTNGRESAHKSEEVAETGVVVKMVSYRTMLKPYCK